MLSPAAFIFFHPFFFLPLLFPLPLSVHMGGTCHAAYLNFCGEGLLQYRGKRNTGCASCSPDPTAPLHPDADALPGWRAIGEKNGTDLGLASVLQNKSVLCLDQTRLPEIRVKPWGHHFGILFNLVQTAANFSSWFFSLTLIHSLVSFAQPRFHIAWVALIIQIHPESPLSAEYQTLCIY